MTENKGLIVGTMAFDEVETPTGSSGKIIAGSATYIALAISFFDVESAIVSIVGQDFPQDYLKKLSNRNLLISVKLPFKKWNWFIRNGG